VPKSISVTTAWKRAVAITHQLTGNPGHSNELMCLSTLRMFQLLVCNEACCQRSISCPKYKSVSDVLFHSNTGTPSLLPGQVVILKQPA